MKNDTGILNTEAPDIPATSKLAAQIFRNRESAPHSSALSRSDPAHSIWAASNSNCGYARRRAASSGEKEHRHVRNGTPSSYQTSSGRSASHPLLSRHFTLNPTGSHSEFL